MGKEGFVRVEKSERKPFSHGQKKDEKGQKENKKYFAITLPKDWCDFNEISSGTKLQAMWSRMSPGYLLYSICPPLEQRKEAVISTQELKKITKENQLVPLVDALRLKLAGYLVHGYEKVTIKYEKASTEGEKIKRALSEYISHIGSLIRYEAIPEKNELVVEISSEGERELEYDFIELSRKILNCYTKLLNHAIDFVERNLDEDIYSKITTFEDELDFLWVYCNRQLVKGINNGFFCGQKFKGVHCVALAGLSKILERNGDNLFRFCKLLYVWRKDRAFMDAFESHKDKFVSVLNRIARQWNKAMEITMSSLKGEWDDDKSRQVAEIIAEHCLMMNEVGEMVGGHIETEKQTLRSAMRKYFGSLGEELVRDKNYGPIFFTILADLQQVAKFPRNVAIGAAFVAGK
jgi:hypothetical protein